MKLTQKLQTDKAAGSESAALNLSFCFWEIHPSQDTQPLNLMLPSVNKVQRGAAFTAQSCSQRRKEPGSHVGL